MMRTWPPCATWRKRVELIRNAAVSEWPPGFERLFGSIDDPTFQAPVRIVSKVDMEAGHVR